MGTPPFVITNKTIAFVSNNAWSVYNFRIDIIRSLINHGNKVYVISPSDEYAAKLEREGCSYVAVEFSNKTENPLADLQFYFRLRAIYKELRPDFIFHYVAKPNIYGSMAAAAYGIPSVAVITGLGYPFARRNLLFYIIRMLYRKALRNVSEVWFLNNDDAKVFVDERIVDISRARILPGEGVNTGYFHPCDQAADNEPFTFLMSTRLLKSKGIAIYADAARVLRNKGYSRVKFNLLGFFEKNHPDSISHDELQQWQQHGLVSWLGFADDVRPHMGAAHCLVFPSYYNEGVPRCLMEAASMQLPAITSMNRGCREVVADGVNGFLTRMNDPFDLAEKMERMMLLTHEERKRMGERGRALVVDKFEISKIIAVYMNTLISAFENSHGSNRKDSRAAEDHRGRI
jgi:glycosyltransferase involved in cell wall biosynthesis